MHETTEATPTSRPTPDWEALPPPARWAFRLGLAGWAALPLIAAVVTGLVLRLRGEWLPPALLAAGLLMLAHAWVYGGLSHRRTRYRLDDDGLRIRRGVCWQGETLVPRSRVQHLDLERGPLERRLGLATLVLHTAGTRMSAVRLPGLDAARARALRDALVDREAGADDDAL
ncbi:PH domain-containing protein [Rehaibacterium terrae]|jgi:membrane protein YdbS with pleckstrin-like domain|uniref:YdbS-like PH domain-containing protein n=1 Tax=Rehaibacterium terrae TaxID=1341696 RepID=A0A7W7XZR7_9GAMM|nr:PH domain-containing protein [Rehaibacterium terrae]MBB5015415.1 hypothetical protein [Rehaibacterium terrae]